MSTITSYHIIKELIDNNGHYLDDPVPHAIFEYNNQFDGGVCWKVCWEERDVRNFFISGAINNPKLLWQNGMGKICDPTPPGSHPL